MVSGSELALVRGLSYLSETQSAIAHNLANVDSSSFKRRAPRAEPVHDRFDDVLGARMQSILFTERLDWTEGTVRPTGDQFHVAISSGDFFRVKGASGQPLYTRNGELSIDSMGRLVSNAGMPYLDEFGQEILIRGQDGQPVNRITVSSNGTISDANDPENVLGKLGMYRVSDQASLRPAGKGVYADTSNQPATLSPGATVNQAMLERSNVDTTNELVLMLGVQRSFQATQRVLTSMHRMKEQYSAAMNR